MAAPKRTPPVKWAFLARFRRGGFGWRASQLAARRLQEALREIKAVARHDPVAAAEGGVRLLEKLSPALEGVDGSSGMLGNRVNAAIDELAALIARAPADPGTRDAWLERLWAALEADKVPWIESLGEHWGDLSASPERASAWADRLIDGARAALSPKPARHVFFTGTTACLSALFGAERYREIVTLLDRPTIWAYRVWAARALVALGQQGAALRLAESCRSRHNADPAIDRFCDQLLRAAGMADEAYARYGLTAHRASTYTGTLKAVIRAYPGKPPAAILTDLVATTPGAEGKWFAAAKDLGLYDEALRLAARSPADPKTLSRAARDHLSPRPDFALECGLLALHWLAQGHGYEITGMDVIEAGRRTLDAARQAGRTSDTRARIGTILEGETGRDRFVGRMLQPLLEADGKTPAPRENG